MDNSKISRQWRVDLALGLVASIVLGWHAASYLPFIADDALISLRYSDRLLAGDGLTWTDGERVEGYSNLLWVLAVAGLGALGLDLVVAARVLGFACSGAMILAVLWFLRRSESRPHVAAPLFGTLSLALAGPIAVWTVGGLEQVLLGALLAWALALLARVLARPPEAATRLAWGAAALLGLMTWTRPDAPLFCAIAAATVAWHHRGRPGLRVAAIVAGLPAAMVFAQLAFRLVYYDDWVPNTAYVKLALSSARLVAGWGYVAASVWATSAVVLPGVLGVVLLGLLPAWKGRRDREGTARNDPTMLMIGAMLLVWSGYLVFIGGDIFPARRHWIVAIVLLAFAGAALFDRLARADRPRAAQHALAAATLCLASFAWQQLARDPANDAAETEVWEWDGQVVGELLRDAFGEARPLVGVDPAGCIPYFSRLPALDLLGLNDRELAHQRSERVGHGWVGHEAGDGAYVMRRAPDILLFCLPYGSAEGCFPSGRELVARPDFHAAYRLLTLVGERPHTVTTRVWMRLDSPKIGVRRAADGSVTVPGYWWASGDPVTARLDAGDTLVTVIPRGKTARLERWSLPPGKWRMRAEFTGALRVRIHGAVHAPVELSRSSNTFTFDVPEGATLEVRIKARKREARLRAVTFEPVAP